MGLTKKDDSVVYLLEMETTDEKSRKKLCDAIQDRISCLLALGMLDPTITRTCEKSPNGWVHSVLICGTKRGE